MKASRTTQPDEVADAERAVADAQGRVGEVEEALLDGAPGVSAADLVQAEDEVERRRGVLARARDIVRIRSERAAEDARLTRIAELRGLIVGHFGQHEGDVVDAFDAAVEALTPLVEAIAAHNDALLAIIGELDAVRPLPQDLDPRSGQLHLPKSDVYVQSIDPARLLTEAAWRALVAAGQNDVAGKLEPTAGIAHDHTTNAKLGVARRADGAAGASGLSDVLRRTARIVAERDS